MQIQIITVIITVSFDFDDSEPFVGPFEHETLCSVWLVPRTELNVNMDVSKLCIVLMY